RELCSVVVRHADIIRHHVIDSPVPGLVDQPKIELGIRLQTSESSPHLRELPFTPFRLIDDELVRIFMKPGIQRIIKSPPRHRSGEELNEQIRKCMLFHLRQVTPWATQGPSRHFFETHMRSQSALDFTEAIR